MNKNKYYVTTLLSLIILVIIGVNLKDRNNNKVATTDSKFPTYKSEYTNTMIYNLDGTLNYRLTARHIEHFSEQGISWFIQPILIIYNKDKIPTWSIKSDQAKLTDDRILYLYDHVEISALTADSQLRKITTKNAQIDITTQDIISRDPVMLHGRTFSSSGLQMRGNLFQKNAQLIEKVRAFYEIQNK